MRIAILGSTSEIARDLVISFFKKTDYDVVLYGRDSSLIKKWCDKVGIKKRYQISEYQSLISDGFYDAVINFIGSGNPARTLEMGENIFHVNLKYDDFALDYLKKYPSSRYLYMSSGAVYGSNFEGPVNDQSKAMFEVNNTQSQHFYALAKIYSELRHRALRDYAIVDIRIFNYFSHTQDMSARFLITDIVRAIQEKSIFITSAENIFRDYLCPADFYGIVQSMLTSKPVNTAIDCYSLAPIDKISLLTSLNDKFNLRYELDNINSGLNVTGSKSHYYSINRVAEKFGYQPTSTSLNGVSSEIKLLIGD
ncbi:NAD-dependent epimerase/dehydratase family protein [Polynucleobacter sp. JS-JIR-5-A7]|uniref:NAD-dependent epimerase/dehydratase family protein n=1 Tax=Polynucleobacter sp. JS-JIR-5-A7 TaxID=1758395 RepID=UPI001BFD5777|nr:NAD-dependent epimerase/dehydratase family protein [Polynucleobacter sp. JS-JIR-5-A7]QWE06932.1 NAD-dependent epimerase/dehydratase family protein [Polynucleobacter sp. JS-JIR-5-A7]